MLEGKVDQARRVVDSGSFRTDQGWHVRRWLRLWEEGRLEDEWNANSYDETDALDVYGNKRPLIVDTRLRDAVAPFVMSERKSLFRRRLHR